MKQLPVKLSGASGVPYYRQIVDQVARAVRSGELGASARLPSVRDSAAQLLVSLITIRRAYSDLEAAGLIVRRQGHGTFVADDVEVASQEQVRTEARTMIADAVETAQRLGLSRGDLRSLFEEIVTRSGVEHGHE